MKTVELIFSVVIPAAFVIWAACTAISDYVDFKKNNKL